MFNLHDWSPPPTTLSTKIQSKPIVFQNASPVSYTFVVLVIEAEMYNTFNTWEYYTYRRRLAGRLAAA